jgi:outer membrane protein OmpA-like peptidoglycan-associated protein
MKKFIVAIAAFMVAFSAQAQDQKNYTGSSRFWDNWSVSVQAGTTEWMMDMGHFSPTIVVGADKYLNPWFGLGADFRTQIGAGTFYNSYTVFDAVALNGYAKFNMTNMLLGYKGHRRMFEPVIYTGLGWTRWTASNDYFGNNDQMTYTAGVEFNFNLGKKRAWAVVVNPAVVWGGIQNGKLNKLRGAFEMTAGFVYHFKTSNGTHDFVKPTLRNQAEIDALNAKINEARAALDASNSKIASLNKEIADLKNRAPQVVTNTVTNTRDNMECYVYFSQGRSEVTASQMPNVERIATFLKNHADASVVIYGYASPEGSAEINQRLANSRAENVKKALIKKYGIKESRIKAEGKGVGDSFSEPDWNRVSICTIKQ